jgi:squalene-hopene/tetraprenyl-beta-curcumene cyclase
VPDVDDTSGALLALAVLRPARQEAEQPQIDEAARAGLRWLLALQNADGGWPTFCRGWGTMPFDRSGVDLTAHAIRALHAWVHDVSPPWEDCGTACLGHLGDPARRAIRRGLRYLQRQQRNDGSWVPLWFGNQYRKDEENPVYGTARVLLAYRDLGLIDSEPARRGLGWLASQCDPDGGWGGGPGRFDGGQGAASVEETAVAVEALLAATADLSLQPVLARGLDWLVRAAEAGRHRESAAIGLYFARLWYYEKLYSLAFTVSALGHALGRWASDTQSALPTPPPSD